MSIIIYNGICMILEKFISVFACKFGHLIWVGAPHLLSKLTSLKLYEKWSNFCKRMLAVWSAIANSLPVKGGKGDEA